MPFSRSSLFLLAFYTSLSVNAQQILTDEDKAFLEAQKQQVDASSKQNTFATGAVQLRDNDFKLSQQDRDLLLRAQQKLLEITEGEIPLIAKGMEDIHAHSTHQAEKYHEEAQNIAERTQYGISRDQYKALQIIAGDDAGDLIAHMREAELQAQQQQEVVETSTSVTYFISYSMPSRIVDEILVKAANTPNSKVAVRGLMDGMDNIGQMIRFVDAINMRLQNQGKIQNYPNVQLAPIEFMKYDITRAPSMVVDLNGVKVKATGLTSIAYMEQKLEDGETDVGVVSETYPIGEMLLFDQIEERVAQVDWDSKKQQAIERYWKNFTFIDLPYIDITKTYFIDPSIVMTQDIPAHNGQLLAYAGQRVNPLELMPVSFTVIVFDATNEEQVAWAERTFKGAAGNVMLVTTKLNRENGWKQLEELTNAFGAQIYMLAEDITQRFALQSVPSVVTTEGTVIRVDAIGRTDWEIGK